MKYDGDKVVRTARAQRGPTQGGKYLTDLGFALSGPARDLWCSVFVSWVMREAGFASLYPATASTQQSFSRYRDPSRLWIIPVGEARAGDIAWLRFKDPRTPSEAGADEVGKIGSGLVGVQAASPASLVNCARARW